MLKISFNFNHILMKRQVSRNFWWGSKSKPSINLLSVDEELKLAQYQGRIENFADNALNFERYMRGLPKLENLPTKTLIPGKCTAEGTAKFKEYAAGKGIPVKNFR